MSDQYQGNQLPGAAYGFPQYYAANQMTNLGPGVQVLELLAIVESLLPVATYRRSRWHRHSALIA